MHKYSEKIMLTLISNDSAINIIVVEAINLVQFRTKKAAT